MSVFKHALLLARDKTLADRRLNSTSQSKVFVLEAFVYNQKAPIPSVMNDLQRLIEGGVIAPAANVRMDISRTFTAPPSASQMQYEPRDIVKAASGTAAVGGVELSHDDVLAATTVRRSARIAAQQQADVPMVGSAPGPTTPQPGGQAPEATAASTGLAENGGTDEVLGHAPRRSKRLRRVLTNQTSPCSNPNSPLLCKPPDHLLHSEAGADSQNEFCCAPPAFLLRRQNESDPAGSNSRAQAPSPASQEGRDERSRLNASEVSDSSNRPASSASHSSSDKPDESSSEESSDSQSERDSNAPPDDLHQGEESRLLRLRLVRADAIFYLCQFHVFVYELTSILFILICIEHSEVFMYSASK